MELAKAVVLAGDCRGPEQWPALGTGARQLVPVANRPVLFHHLDALVDAGVREAAIVTDATTGASIRDAVGDGADWGLALTHLKGDGTPNVLASAPVADFVGSSPVLVHQGDVLLRERLSALEDDFAQHDLDALIMRPGAGGGDAPARGSAGYIIGSDVHPSLRREVAALDDALERLVAAGARVGVREVDACMPCRGGADELLEGNRRMLERLTAGRRGERIFDSKLQGPVSVHPSAEVRASVIRGPVVIGPGARIANAYIGPYTSIGADVEIDCVEIEYSIVLDRAQIRFFEARVEGSVIGPGARVTRDFNMPRAVRLTIGAGAQVWLA
jgi:glucose-1-phosphate thymidylyltransferase